MSHNIVWENQLYKTITTETVRVKNFNNNHDLIVEYCASPHITTPIKEHTRICELYICYVTIFLKQAYPNPQYPATVTIPWQFGCNLNNYFNNSEIEWWQHHTNHPSYPLYMHSLQLHKNLLTKLFHVSLIPDTVFSKEIYESVINMFYKDIDTDEWMQVLGEVKQFWGILQSVKKNTVLYGPLWHGSVLLTQVMNSCADFQEHLLHTHQPV